MIKNLGTRQVDQEQFKREVFALLSQSEKNFEFIRFVPIMDRRYKQNPDGTIETNKKVI